MRIALDDFGTGYATLSQLLSFHLDKIKIDRSFVSGLEKSEGERLRLDDNGIEDTAQLNYLKANGCTEGQGYLFSKAIPAEVVRFAPKVAIPASSIFGRFETCRPAGRSEVAGQRSN